MRIRNTGKPYSSEKLESYDVFETICDPQLVIDTEHLMQIPTLTCTYIGTSIMQVGTAG
jgi:hypothetical protein